MSLAEDQAALVASLVAGAPTPPGFDARRLAAARAALLRKRAGEVARAWPQLAGAYGERWAGEFAAWAAGRPAKGSLHDGWDFAVDHPPWEERAKLEVDLYRRRRRFRSVRRLLVWFKPAQPG